MKINRLFVGTCHVFLQCRITIQARNHHFYACCLFRAGFSLQPWRWGDMVLRNIGWISTEYSALSAPTVLYSSDSAFCILRPTGHFVYINNSCCYNGLDDGGVGVWVPVGSRIFSSLRHPDRFWGSPSVLSNGYRGLILPEVKRPRHEAEHSPPTSAEVNKTWIYTSTVLYSFVA
jgi:hypothetical protein